ncbi:hypothetical protein C8R48DRAFT_773649 [Suillus tomentosus]|nr:hypothetical protein C8R48DRAFT_773649 [Suillus tomentosus]
MPFPDEDTISALTESHLLDVGTVKDILCLASDRDLVLGITRSGLTIIATSPFRSQMFEDPFYSKKWFVLSDIAEEPEDEPKSKAKKENLKAHYWIFKSQNFLQQGADSAQGDDTSKLKALMSDWVNHEFRPNLPVDSDNKNSRGFVNDVCSRLLCPTELDWNDPAVKSGIWDRAKKYIVTDLSFLAFLYESYATNPDDLEEGLFKSKILLQGYKAVFTSPSSAKDIEGDGDGADIIENNRHEKVFSWIQG